MLEDTEAYKLIQQIRKPLPQGVPLVGTRAPKPSYEDEANAYLAKRQKEFIKADLLSSIAAEHMGAGI